MANTLNQAILQLSRRTEQTDDSVLASTFVSAGSLFEAIISKDHQILYGRRGTGKTHVLKVLCENRQKVGDIAIYIDLRTIGSNGGIYQDSSIPLVERGTRLLCDVFEYIYNELVNLVVQGKYESNLDFKTASESIEIFREGISNIYIAGNHEKTLSNTNQESTRKIGSASISLSRAPEAKLATEKSSILENQQESIEKVVGPQRTRFHFGTVGQSLGRVIDGLGSRMWLLLDEWSDLPPDLQPLLADMLRRTVMPLKKTTLKIGAIEKRSNFIESDGKGGYLGFELGADISADMRLDDFMVFGNDVNESRSFFADLFSKHINNILSEQDLPLIESSQAFIDSAFTQNAAFDDLVRAGEGNPRDALNIAISAARKAGDNKISRPNIRDAARNWYLSDKEKNVKINAQAGPVLNWIIEIVIGKRKARAFMLAQGVQSDNELISFLYDTRVIHLAKTNISSKDNPGTRYDAYVLDYGCYVHLINTQAEPKGMFEVEDDAGEEGYVDVPKDDYRSIRRAILDMKDFETSLAKSLE